MKKTTKFMAVILMIASICMLPVYADNNDELLNQGCSQETIEELTEEEKTKLLNENFVYAGTDECQLNSSYRFLNRLNPDSEMTLRVTKWIKKSEDGALEEIFVTANYGWNKVTRFAFEDKWQISWDNQNLRCKDDSYRGITRNYVGKDNYQFSDYYQDLANSGVGTFGGYVDQRYNYRQEHVQKFYLVPKEDNLTSGSVHLYFNYTHIFGIPGITFSLPFNINTGITDDSLDASVVIEW